MNEQTPYDYQNRFVPPPFNQWTLMARASMTIATISLITCFTGFFSLTLSGIAILFAVLSTDSRGHRLRQAKIAILTGMVAIVAAYAILVSTVYTYLHTPELRQQLNDYSRQIYGVTFDEMLEELYGNE